MNVDIILKVHNEWYDLKSVGVEGSVKQLVMVEENTLNKINVYTEAGFNMILKTAKKEKIPSQ